MTSELKGIWKATKNTVLQVPEIERKVKEATSNEKWGPTSTQMREIAQATYSYHDLPLIMGAIWRRLDDHGKYWRHVYKALLLIDYLVKNGSEQVIRECRDHVIAIQTLTEFQHIDEKDQDVGLSVRERAKQIIELLHDEKRIKLEREKAKNTAKKFLVGIGSEQGGYGGYEGGRNDHYGGGGNDRDSYYGRDKDRDEYDEPNRSNPTFDDEPQETYTRSGSVSEKARPRAASGGSSLPPPSSKPTQPQPQPNLFDFDDVPPATTTGSRNQEFNFFGSNNSTPFGTSNTASFGGPVNNSAPFNNNAAFVGANSSTPFGGSTNNSSFGGPARSNDGFDSFDPRTGNTQSNDNWGFDSNDNGNTSTNTAQQKQIDPHDPWARKDLFDFSGSKNTNATASTTSKTPMGALPSAKPAMGAPSGPAKPANPTLGGMNTGVGMNPNMGMGGMNAGMGGMGMNPGMGGMNPGMSGMGGMGMNPGMGGMGGMGMNPGMGGMGGMGGMNPGMGGMGMGMNPGMGGMNPGMGGMGGMNTGMGMNPGMGGMGMQSGFNQPRPAMGMGGVNPNMGSNTRPNNGSFF